MLLYRVFPYLDDAGEGDPGHALHVHPVQGGGRWDNPSLYRTCYLATSPEAAIGEAFGNLVTWTPAMLVFPGLPGSQRRLGVYRFDEEANPLIDLDDAHVLAERGIRPTDVVVRNRTRTQEIAAGIYNERKWSGIRWWSYHRPQWSLVALWTADKLSVVSVDPIGGHTGLELASSVLAKLRTGI